MFKNEEGFSLLELVVAVGVAGIIAAVALPTFAGLQDKATTTSATYAASASAAEALANSTIGGVNGTTSNNSSYTGGMSSSAAASSSSSVPFNQASTSDYFRGAADSMMGGGQFDMTTIMSEAFGVTAGVSAGYSFSSMSSARSLPAGTRTYEVWFTDRSMGRIATASVTVGVVGNTAYLAGSQMIFPNPNPGMPNSALNAFTEIFPSNSYDIIGAFLTTDDVLVIIVD